MITQNSYEVTVCFQPLYSHFNKLNKLIEVNFINCEPGI